MKTKTYRHYGAMRFDSEKFSPAKNIEHWIKPHGCLWACDIESNDWYGYCYENDWENQCEEYFDFTLAEETRLLELRGMKDFEALAEKYFISESKNLDFEQISMDYDALYVELDHELYWALYGWDIDSLLVFNPNVIRELG